VTTGDEIGGAGKNFRKFERIAEGFLFLCPSPWRNEGNGRSPIKKGIGIRKRAKTEHQRSGQIRQLNFGGENVSG